MKALTEERPGRAARTFAVAVVIGTMAAWALLADSLGSIVVVVACLLFAWDIYLAFFYGGSRA